MSVCVVTKFVEVCGSKKNKPLEYKFFIHINGFQIYVTEVLFVSYTNFITLPLWWGSRPDGARLNMFFVGNIYCIITILCTNVDVRQVGNNFNLILVGCDCDMV